MWLQLWQEKTWSNISCREGTIQMWSTLYQFMKKRKHLNITWKVCGISLWINKPFKCEFCDYSCDLKMHLVSLHEWKKPFKCTLGGIASICFRFHFHQTLRMHTQGCQGCQKAKNFLRNSKLLIARSTIQPKLSKIKNH